MTARVITWIVRIAVFGSAAGNDTIRRMRTEAGVTGELPGEALPQAEEVTPLKIRKKTELGLVLLVSATILIPCFWQRHIQAGDLASHVYNAWLAQMVGEGKAPGVYAVWQSKNVLFDLMLLKLGNVFGFRAAEKIAVSLCVLVFFWGVFTLISVATRKRPWLLVPGLAMLAYSYVFYMGFMNYYLSLGLACSFSSEKFGNPQNPLLCSANALKVFFIDCHKPRRAARQQVALGVANLSHAKPVSALLFFLPAFDHDLLVHRHRLPEHHVQLRGHRFFFRQFRNLAHRFVQHHRDDATVREARSAGVIRSQHKTPAYPLGIEVEIENQTHPGFVISSTTKAAVRFLGIEFEDFSHF